MSIVRDNGDERQIRVDRMIEEFRKAQSRRPARAVAVKGGEHAVESGRDATGAVADPGSTTTSTSHSNG